MKALITGGKGNIAQAIKLELLKNGFRVDTPSHQELDVTDIDDVIEYMKRNQVDVLVNCAGYIDPRPIINMSMNKFEKHFSVNVLGAFICSKYALLRNPKCIIINIGSSAGLKGKKDWSAYCASKAALISLTESMHEEGYKAVCVSIGRTKTKMRFYLYGQEDDDTLLMPREVGYIVEKVISAIDIFSGKNINVKKVDKKVECWIESEVRKKCILKL